MDLTSTASLFILILFFLGYAAIILETHFKVNKSATGLLMACLLWMIYFATSTLPMEENLKEFGVHVFETAEILFFLMGALTIVEIIDCHHGFVIVTDYIKTSSQRYLLWIVSFLTFFFSAVFDNLTTTIVMISLIRKLVPDKAERFVLNCMIIIAANAGGAWTPIGDVTTTMLWIGNRITTLSVMKSLFIPSVVSLVVPLLFYTYKARGRFKVPPGFEKDKMEPGAKVVFVVGVLALLLVPILKTTTGLPPFMGILLGLSLLWIITDIMHFPFADRGYLRVPHILTRIDTSGILFFLGILLSVKVLDTMGALSSFATWMNEQIGSVVGIAASIGIISAIIDNVPLVAATMGMYDLQNYPLDSPLWHLIAYAAGTGGSLLIIGSSAGVALMGMEKIDFIQYMKKATLPVLAGYLAGIVAYWLLFI